MRSSVPDVSLARLEQLARARARSVVYAGSSSQGTMRRRTVGMNAHSGRKDSTSKRPGPGASAASASRNTADLSLSASM